MAPPHTVFATPTTRLSIADPANCTYRPEKCIALVVEAKSLTVAPPMPTSRCPFWYHLRPPLYPPLICSTSLSSSISTLVICTRSPVRAAGPLSRPIRVHCFLSYQIGRAHV